MPDENQNMIPDKWDRVILRAGTALTALLGGVIASLVASGTPVPLWLPIVSAALPTALTLFSFGGTK